MGIFDFLSKDKIEDTNSLSFIDDSQSSNSLSFIDDNESTNSLSFINDESSNSLSFMDKPEESQNLVWKILDVVQAPQYGIVNSLKDALDGGDFKPLQSFYAGLSLKEKTSVGDILTNAGWNPESFMGKAAKFGVGLAGDIALDPLTYTGVGLVNKAGKALSVAKSAGKAKWVKTLGWVDDAGSKLDEFKDLDKFGKIMKGSELERMTKAGIKTGEGAGEGIEHSLTFMGRPIKGTEAVGKIAEPVTKGLYDLRNTKAVAKVLDPLSKAISTRIRPSTIDATSWEKLLKFKDEYQSALQTGKHSADKLGKMVSDKIEKEGLDPEQVSTIVKNLENGIKPNDMSSSLEKFAGKVGVGLEKIYKGTWAKDLYKDSELMHLSHVAIRSKNPKYFTDELKDPDLSRNILKVSGIVPETDYYAEFLYNKKTGNLFNGSTKPALKLTIDDMAKLEKGELDGVKLSQISIDEANKKFGKKIFSTDLSEIMKSKAGATYEAKSLDTLINKTAKELGSQHGYVVTDPKKSYLSKKVLEAFPHLNKTVFDKEVAGHLNKAYEMHTNPEVPKGIMKVFDSLQNTWKASATLVNPAFHTRNFLSNIVQNESSGVGPEFMLKAKKLEDAFRKGNISVADKKLMKEFRSQGLDKTGYLSAEFNDVKLSDIHKDWNIIAKGWDKATTIGGKVGQAIENNAKLAHFIAKREAGMSARDAALSVKRALFDPGDLTQFEQKYLRRALPFYSWTRKNVPYQVQTLFSNPTKSTKILKLKNNIEVMTGDDETSNLLPKWMKDSMPIFIGKSGGKLRYVKLEGLVPVADLNKLAPDKAVQTMIEMFTPVLKTPAEQALNYNFFFGSKITGSTGTGTKAELFKGWPGQEGTIGEREFFNTRIPGRIEHLARLFRPITEIEKLVSIPFQKASRRNIDEDYAEKLGKSIIGSVFYGETPKVLLDKFKKDSTINQANVLAQINLLRKQMKLSPQKREQNIQDIRTLTKLYVKARRHSVGVMREARASVRQDS